jgi:hypothetical protein
MYQRKEGVSSGRQAGLGGHQSSNFHDDLQISLERWMARDWQGHLSWI